VERCHGTLQDRLVKALRLAGISTLAEANAFLEREFLRSHNRRFMSRPASPADVHRNVPAGMVLAEVLCVQEKRVVGRDWCVTYGGQVLQLDKQHEKLALAGRTVTVLELASGSLRLLHRGRRLRWRAAPSRPALQTAPKPIRTAVPWRPPADHPWRAALVTPASLRSASLRSASLRDAGVTRLTG
jgi:hypothetical protein